ncbi:MAG TPA: hemolysin family protein [Bryobacteraceae bacterium]|nr:hemolysin family protein [Bryobacteraceae bacterium]
MIQSDLVFRLLLVAGLVLMNGFFAGAEVALVSVRNSRLRQMAEDGVVGAQTALNLLARPERLLSVVQVGVTVASLGLGWVGEPTVFLILASLLAPIQPAGTEALLHAVSFVVAFAIISYFHVVFGEVIPKNLAIERSDRLAVLVAPPLLVIYRLTLPFVVIIERSAAAVSRLLRISTGAGAGGHSAEELKLIVSSSRVVAEEQEEMIHRVLDLSHTYVREIMVPRKDMVSISVEADLDEVLHAMIEQQHSRLPVWEGSPEQIIGILHYKDLLPVWEERKGAVRSGRPARTFQVRWLMRKQLVVPETKPLTQMLEEFKLGRSHMALVVDEFGTIVGLVTVEDVLEAIVGAIADEYDERAVRPALAVAEIEIDGATRIRDLDIDYGIEIPADGGFETLAGFLLDKLGYIPAVGDSVEYDRRRFTVMAMDRNRIARVRIEKLAPPAEPMSGQGELR